MNATTVLDLRSIEAARLVRAVPPKPSDTVIVKLRITPRSVKRLAVAAGLEPPPASVQPPILTALLERGYVSEIVPVFPAERPFAEGRGPARALAAAVLDAPIYLKRARGLCSMKVDRGTHAETLAEYLSQQPEEVEYAYVPPAKYLFLPPRRGKPRARRATVTTPNDPLTSRQWNHGTVRIHQARARQGFVEADDVLVAIVDSNIAAALA